MLTMFFLLMVSHAVCDFALQSDTMAKMKNRNNPSQPPPGQKPVSCWFYFLTAHSVIHGGGVYLVTGNMVCALIETGSHWCVDYVKCLNITNPHQDQMLHLMFKFLIIFWMFHPVT